MILLEYMLAVCKGVFMRNPKSGKTSVVAKERYNSKTYQQVNFRTKISEFPTKKDIEDSADRDGMSLNAWLISAVVDKINGGCSVKIPDLEIYAKSAGISPEEYIKQAVLEKMERQDNSFTESVEREKIEE